MTQQQTPLSQTRVLDLSDERSIYGVKLLADNGATTIRPEPLSGDALRRRGPFDNETDESLWYLYYASSRHQVQLTESIEESRQRLSELVLRADVCFLGADNELAQLIEIDKALDENKSLVIVDCSPFGTKGPWSEFKAPELIAAALGGSAGVTGTPDTPPLKLFGELNFNIVGAYVAVAALSGIRHAKESGQGQFIEVNAHECIASSLEHVFMWYFYQAASPNARAKALERRGSLHWTNLYEVMSTKNGAMMVTPTPNLDAQLAWLIEENAFQDLLEPRYEELENRREFYQRFMQVIRDWVGEQDTEELFFKAQDRHSPYGWVQDIAQVAENPQLEARDWWQSLKLAEKSIKIPGPAFRFAETPAKIRRSEWVDVGSTDVLSEIGWGTNS